MPTVSESVSKWRESPELRHNSAIAPHYSDLINTELARLFDNTNTVAGRSLQGTTSVVELALIFAVVAGSRFVGSQRAERMPQECFISNSDEYMNSGECLRLPS